MIKFFRKIRYNLIEQNKTGKYFKYAIGEIVLVVIGILIALQINNWNSIRNDRLLEDEYLIRLAEETRWNIKQLDYSISQYLDQSKELNKVIEYIEKGVHDSTENNVGRPNYIHPWIVKNSIYNELVSTGDLKIIRDVHLRDLIDEAHSVAYFAEQQLQIWRDLAIAHESYFIPYKKSLQEKDTDNSIYYISALDFDKMKGDSIVIELLKHWSVGNIVFHDGTIMLKNHYEKILERIECMKKNDDCPITKADTIKN